jgi:hypothetical protein
MAGHDIRRVRDREAPLRVGPSQNATAVPADSQDDSQLRGSMRTTAHVCGLLRRAFNRERTAAAVGGPQARGLQNRGRSSADVRLSSRACIDVRRLGL